MNYSLCVFLSTIAGEAGACQSPNTWQAVACSIMNRVGKREWVRHDTVLKVIAFTGFDAFKHKNKAYRDAYDYYNSGVQMKAKKVLDDLRRICEPIFNGQVRPYPTVVLYYSPMAMVHFHQTKPELYKSAKPGWDFSVLKQVFVMGATQDDMAFYAYK